MNRLWQAGILLLIIGLVFDYFGLPIVMNGSNQLFSQQLLYYTLFLSTGLSLTIIGVVLTAFGYSEKDSFNRRKAKEVDMYQQ